MTDYPDYTSLMQIIGSDIMVPIDIQGAYIMMPVDLQAQYITLEIDIVAQSVGNIGIDISAQTVGDITINLNTQSIGLYIIRDWETKEDNDKSLTGEQEIAASATVNVMDYTVPANHLLYVDDFVASGIQYGTYKLKIGGVTIFSAYANLNGSVICTYSTPKKALATEHVIVEIKNRAEAAADFSANVGGRELTIS